MFVYPGAKVKEPGREIHRKRLDRVTLVAMAKRHEPTTEELRQLQRERTTEEHRAVDQSATPDEKRQHRRRAQKSAYLERMLAERERSERERKRGKD
jgi:hypothetical protein